MNILHTALHFAGVVAAIGFVLLFAFGPGSKDAR